MRAFENSTLVTLGAILSAVGVSLPHATAGEGLR